MLLALFAVVVMVGGCERPADESTPGGGPLDRADRVDRPGRADDSAPADYDFILMSGGDTVAAETYTRGDDLLEGELRGWGSGDRVAYRAALGSEARITRLEVSAYAAGDAAPDQQVELEVRGDSLMAEYTRDGARRRDATSIPAGTLLYLNPSVALLEQMLLRAREVGGERVELTVLSISADDEPELIHPVVTWIGADSVRIVVGEGNEVHAEVESPVRILRAENRLQNVRIERVRRPGG
jgi:hypothetical protein